MRLLALNDLQKIASWPHYTNPRFLWANFSYRNPQEQKFWFRGNSTEKNFWFSVFIDPILSEDRQYTRRYLKALSQGKTTVSIKRERSKKGFLRRNPKEPILVGRISTLVPDSFDELIFGIALHPDYLELGIGTIATQMYLFAVFVLTPVQSVWLETQHENIRAQHVYEKIGFQKLGYHYKADSMGRQEKRFSYIYRKEWADHLPPIFEIN